MNNKVFKKGDKVFFLSNDGPVCAFVINAAAISSNIIIVEEVISLVTREMTSNSLFASREEAIEAMKSPL